MGASVFFNARRHWWLMVVILWLPMRAVAAPRGIAWWLTTGSQSALLQQQQPLEFGNLENQSPAIIVDSARTYQRVDGFGFALTGSSAMAINQLPAANRAALLNELFGHGSDAIGISYLRLTIGASDLSPSVYTYDDMPSGQTDEALTHFSLGPDQSLIVPLLQQILKINPKLKIMASPWTAPFWMKDNHGAVGGSLDPRYDACYAAYFVKYLEAMEKAGLRIDAVTIQNEPLCITNNPSMGWTAQHEAAFIKNNLGPAFRKAGIDTKIVIWDHNCDNVQFPKTVLADPAASEFIDGSAFHLYSGDISALGDMHKTYPNKNVYFTEQYTAASGDFGGDLKWHLRNVLTGAMRNWSRDVIEWNLASNSHFGPHTDGGCSTCKGALTIAGTAIQRNVSYYIIAHASKFVPTGSMRIWSGTTASLNTVAFLTPGGGKVLIVENDSSVAQTFNIKYNGEWVACTLEGGSVATYVW